MLYFIFLQAGLKMASEALRDQVRELKLQLEQEKHINTAAHKAKVATTLYDSMIFVDVYITSCRSQRCVNYGLMLRWTNRKP